MYFLIILHCIVHSYASNYYEIIVTKQRLQSNDYEVTIKKESLQSDNYERITKLFPQAYYLYRVFYSFFISVLQLKENDSLKKLK